MVIFSLPCSSGRAHLVGVKMPPRPKPPADFFRQRSLGKQLEPSRDFQSLHLPGLGIEADGSGNDLIDVAGKNQIIDGATFTAGVILT